MKKKIQIREYAKNNGYTSAFILRELQKKQIKTARNYTSLIDINILNKYFKTYEDSIENMSIQLNVPSSRIITMMNYIDPTFAKTLNSKSRLPKGYYLLFKDLYNYKRKLVYYNRANSKKINLKKELHDPDINYYQMFEKLHGYENIDLLQRRKKLQWKIIDLMIKDGYNVEQIINDLDGYINEDLFNPTFAKMVQKKYLSYNS